MNTIYAIHASILKSEEQKWLTYLFDTHIPDVLNTGYFHDFCFRKVLDPVEENDEYSHFYVEYYCESFAAYQEYQEKAAAPLREDHISKFGHAVKATRTVLEKITR